MSLYSLAIDSLKRMWTPKPIGGTYFYPLLSNNLFGDINYVREYLEIPELNAVINKRAKAFTQGTFNVVNDDGETQEDHWFQKLIKNPNWFQAEKEFIEQSKLFHDIFGNEYIYNLSPVGFSNVDRTKALYTLPPQLVDIKYNDRTPYYRLTEAPDVKYVVMVNGHQDIIDAEFILHQNDNRINITEVNNASVLKGDSKMLGLRPALCNIRMAYESRGVILKRRGAMGILANGGKDAAGSIAIDPKEVDTIQESYRRYGGLEGQDSLIITSAPLTWQKMEVSPDKLGLFDETREDFNKILDAYDTPSDLFVRDKANTYANQREARKGIIVDTVWPEATEWCGAMNRKFLKEEKVKLVVDYSHLPYFQEDLSMTATALNTMVQALSKSLADNAITIEEYQNILKSKFNIFANKK